MKQGHTYMCKMEFITPGLSSHILYRFAETLMSQKLCHITNSIWIVLDIGNTETKHTHTGRTLYTKKRDNFTKKYLYLLKSVFFSNTKKITKTL